MNEFPKKFDQNPQTHEYSIKKLFLPNTTEIVSSQNEFSNHVSDKHPQSKNINVPALDVLIENFEI